MGKHKEIQIEVSDEVYSALEQLANDLNKAETIILNRTGKQELIGQRSMTVEHIALLEIEPTGRAVCRSFGIIGSKKK